MEAEKEGGQGEEGARNSTASKASASTSRQTASAAPSSRSLRSRTAVPDDHAHDSLSRTPGKKRRLSNTPVQSLQDDPASIRRAKKPRIEMHVDRREDVDNAPPKKPFVDQSDGEEPQVVRSNGKGKAVDQQLPKSARRFVKNPSLLQRQRDKFANNDDFDADGTLTPPRLFSLERRGRSNVLSSDGQARLDRFDRSLVSPQPTPLFYPASSEDRDSPAPSLASPRPSPSRTGSPIPELLPAPSPPPPRPRSRAAPSPVASDYATQPPTPPPQPKIPRQMSRRRTAEDSYRVGDVPETQSVPPSPSPPSRASPKKATVISKMKPRSKTSSAIMSPAKNAAGGVRSIPMMTASQFATRVLDGRNTGEEADVDEVDELMSSIEQFSSPERKSRRLGGHTLVQKKDKGKGRQQEVDEDEDEDERAAHELIIARGVEMADLKRAERRAQMAVYARPHLPLSEILKTHVPDGESLSLTESDIPIRSMGRNGVEYSRDDLDALRQEEEENTQDVMAQYLVDDPHGEDGGRRDDEHGNGGGADHLAYGMEAPAKGDEAGNLSDADAVGEAEGDEGDEAGYRSEAGHSANSPRNRSEDRETDVDKSLDLDGPERSAWIQEQSQILQDMPNETSPDVDHDDSMESLMYPDDDEPVPEVPPAPVHVTNRQITKSKSRSNSARYNKPADDADLVLPPTASTRQNTPAPATPPVEPPADPRHLDAAMSLLNVKSDENRRLERLLAEARALLAEERAKTVTLQERVDTLEHRPFSQPSTNDGDLDPRLAVYEERLTSAQASLAAALKSKESAEAERDKARSELADTEKGMEVFRASYAHASQYADEKAAENKELEKRVKIAEEATREGIATIKATFDLREVALKSETRDWRNQANFLREQAIRTNDPDLRRRAAEHPELVAKYGRLADENDDLKDRLSYSEDDLLVKQDEIDRLEARLAEVTGELDSLKAGTLGVDGDFKVLRCGWRAEVTNVACPALCVTQEDLDLHASMHVTKALVDPALSFVFP
ncbi:hypothetical protein B0H15DRAFT_461032 [Mycena belliarum]|uniref:Uncharacterized protein n=1 Tax=Mycena belliarum TaxID=1033014 RepID=A0AAD6UHN7_9AGAR|nr:hypothetical protein B0H15DRAFT_461032 [Mycena belliae]